MKRIFKFIGVALQSLFSNKSRTLLTMLGIIIGIGSVIMMVSVGKGAEALILASVRSFGDRSIFIQPGGGEAGPPSVTAIDKVKYKDYLAIKNLGLIEDVAPLLIYQSAVSFGSSSFSSRIVGTNENYAKAINAEVGVGRFISEDDVNNANKVAVLGLTNASDLFGDRNPLGEKIKINGYNYEVIGVMGLQGTRFFQDFDKRIMIPVTAMKSTVFGVDYLMAITGNAVGNIDETINDLTYFIRKRHAIYNPTDDPNQDDFRVVSQVDAAKTFQQVADVLTVSLVAIAAISLLVGGIGIMNIMLVAVSERTREIGLRKAVGATNSDISLQFLIEAVVLTFAAGVLGVISGIGLSWLIAIVLQNFQRDWQFVVTLDSVLVAFVVSVLIGLVFGIYPARSAARLDPIECLRTE
ncbi:ABC transporter permease [Candidatus Peregrinibacteria bacterium]|nr:ABC transporter permease [Candidatus Peregrinibacteria bacterium]